MVDQTRTSGRAVARTDGKFPDVSVAAGRKSFKAELDGLRDRMRGLGFPTIDEIAAEIGRRYRTRPRDTYAAAGAWLRRMARDPGVSPWLLLDQLTAPDTCLSGLRSRPLGGSEARLVSAGGAGRGAGWMTAG